VLDNPVWSEPYYFILLLRGKQTSEVGTTRYVSYTFPRPGEAEPINVRYVLTVDARVEALDVLFGGHVGYDVRKHLTKFVECCLFAMRDYMPTSDVCNAKRNLEHAFARMARRD
jgi:hypothetical protein